jgi:hypothetical protein
MSMKLKVRMLTAGASVLAVAGLAASFGLAAGSSALAQGGGGAQPPWFSEYGTGQAPVGGITFYNAQGQVVTGGSITADGLAAYAVADTADPLAPHLKATLEFSTPSSANPLDWTTQELSAFSTTYPVTTAPAPISSTTNPVETNNSDNTIATLITGVPNTDTATGYAGLYDIRLIVSGGTGGTTSEFWDAVISVDITGGTATAPTAGTWTIDYPDFTTTSTAIAASPTSEEGVSTPTPATLTATVTPSAATGTVSFWTGYGTSSAAQVGSTQTVSDGTASISTTPPADADTTYTAVFTPAIGSDYVDSNASLSFLTTPPPDATTTTLSETGGGGAAGTPVTFSGTVTDTSADPVNPVDAGTVSLYDNGSTTPLATTAVSSTGTFTTTYTYAAAGSHSVVATYSGTTTGTPLWASSSSAAVAFTESAPQCTTCTNVASISATVPAGTLAVYTPFTASNPLNLGTLSLNSAGTYLSTSGTLLDSDAADVPTAGTIPDATFNGISVVDTQAGNLPWTITALASALSDGGKNPGSTISGENVGLTGLTAVPVPGNALTAADLTFTNQPAASPPVSPTDTGDLGLGGTAAHLIVTDATQADGTIGINGTVTLTAPTSTEAGLFTGTITITIAS